MVKRRSETDTFFLQKKCTSKYIMTKHEHSYKGLLRISLCQPHYYYRAVCPPHIVPVGMLDSHARLLAQDRCWNDVLCAREPRERWSMELRVNSWSSCVFQFRKNNIFKKKPFSADARYNFIIVFTSILRSISSCGYMLLLLIVPKNRNNRHVS